MKLLILTTSTLSIVSKWYVDEFLLTEAETFFQTLQMYFLFTQMISG